jgi:gas vesicle protein
MSKLLVGFTIGLLAGLLIAPDKGSESRKKLERAGRDLKNKFNDFVDNLSDKWESFKSEANTLASEARQEAKSYSNKAGASWEGT